MSSPEARLPPFTCPACRDLRSTLLLPGEKSDGTEFPAPGPQAQEEDAKWKRRKEGGGPIFNWNLAEERPQKGGVSSSPKTVGGAP